MPRDLEIPGSRILNRRHIDLHLLFLPYFHPQKKCPLTSGGGGGIKGLSGQTSNSLFRTLTFGIENYARFSLIILSGVN